MTPKQARVAKWGGFVTAFAMAVSSYLTGDVATAFGLLAASLTSVTPPPKAFR